MHVGRVPGRLGEGFVDVNGMMGGDYHVWIKLKVS